MKIIKLLQMYIVATKFAEGEMVMVRVRRKRFLAGMLKKLPAGKTSHYRIR